MPHPTMPKEFDADFVETRTISDLSPRGAAALLRVVTDRVLLQLLPEEPDLINRIDALVKRGMVRRLQEALDPVRLIENDSRRNARH